MPEIRHDTLAILQYTSGSLAEPKAVMITHASLIANAKAIQQGFQDTEDTIGVSWLPFYHDMGLMGCMIQVLYVNASMYYLSPMMFLQRPIRWLNAISKYAVTTSGAPDFAYDLCTKKIKPEQLQQLDLSHWKVAFIGAEPIKIETLNKFTETFSVSGFDERAFYPCYGMSETILLASGGEKWQNFKQCQIDKRALKNHRIELNGDLQTFVSNGRVRDKHEIAIVNPDSEKRCAADQIGEIWLCGPSIAKGYWQQDEFTKKTFHAYLSDTGEGPYLRTGDLGFVLEGELYVVGRLKEMLIIRGRNHFPHDIELTVQQCHPGFSNYSSAFLTDKNGQQQLTIVQEVQRNYCSKSNSNTLDIKDSIKKIRHRVVDEHGLYVHQVFFVKIGAIPRTSSGKVRRVACQEKLLKGELAMINS